MAEQSAPVMQMAWCPRASPSEVGMDPEPLRELDERLRAAAAAQQPPGLAYAVLRHGRLVASGAYGTYSSDAAQPWRLDTLCRLFSMTKTIAVCGFMALVEDGLVSMDDPLSKFIPAFAAEHLEVADESETPGPNNKAQCEITIRHLLTHSSGISYASAMGDEPSCPTEACYKPLVDAVDSGEIQNLEQWCQKLSSLPLRFQPGERWEYSYSIDVLGRIIEIASGRSLDVFLQERILEPLGMSDTGYAITPEKAHRLADFLRGQEEERLEVVDSANNSLWLAGRQNQVLSAGGAIGSVSGGLVSSLDDFARLCLMLQQGGTFQGRRVLQPESVRQMCENMLPAVTGRPDSWCLETAGLGFGAVGSVAVPHEEANWYDVPGEVGWGGLAGTAWAIDHNEGLVVLTFCQVMYELWIDEEARKAVRKSLGMVPAGQSISTSEVTSEVPSEATSEATSEAPEAPEMPETDVPETPEPRALKREDDSPSSPRAEKRPRIQWPDISLEKAAFDGELPASMNGVPTPQRRASTDRRSEEM